MTLRKALLSECDDIRNVIAYERPGPGHAISRPPGRPLPLEQTALRTDYPSSGRRRDGQVVVARSYDRPDEIAFSWCNYGARLVLDQRVLQRRSLDRILKRAVRAYPGTKSATANAIVAPSRHQPHR